MLFQKALWIKFGKNLHFASSGIIHWMYPHSTWVQGIAGILTDYGFSLKQINFKSVASFGK